MVELHGGDLLADRLVVVCQGEFVFPDPRPLGSVIDVLASGMTPFGGRFPRHYRWRRNGARQLALRPVTDGAVYEMHVDASFAEPTAVQPNRIGVRANITVNPTRVRARFGGDPLDPVRLYDNRAESIDPAISEALGNTLPSQTLLNPGAPYHWIQDAALIAEQAVRIVSQALFSRRDTNASPAGLGRFFSVSLRQAEIYSDFACPRPVEAIDAVYHGLRRGAGTAYRDTTIADEDGYRIIMIPQIERATTNAVFYSKGDGRIRGEMRYLKDISSAAPGSGSGPLVSRLTVIADNAAYRLNRLLRSSRLYRRQLGAAPPLGPIDLAAAISRVVTGSQLGAVLTSLRDFGNVRAGTGSSAPLTHAQAECLRRQGVLDRRPNRARDRGGTVYSLGRLYAAR